MHLLISGIPPLYEVKKREDNSIHLTDIDKYSQMIPRFLQSLKGLGKVAILCKQRITTDTLDFANHTTQNRNIQLQGAKKMTKAKIKFAAKRCQKSLFDCFHIGKKLATGVSTEVESSDYD